MPWQGIRAWNKRQKYEKIGEVKRSISIERLCAGLPREFPMFLNYCRRLKFNDEPDYRYLKEIFRDLFVRSNYSNDQQYDWIDFPNENSLQNKEGKLNKCVRISDGNLSDLTGSFIESAARENCW